METNRRVKITVYIVTGAWSLALLILGIKLPGPVAKILGLLPSLIVGGFALFDSWLWHTKTIIRLVHRPELNGTWIGEFISIRDSDGTGEKAHNPEPAFLVIRQSYLTFNVSLISAKSTSYSFAEDVRRRVGDQFLAYYQYTNTPDLLLRKTSPEHDGGVKLTISGFKPQVLTAEYWTNRSTRGTYRMTKLGSQRVGTWQEGQALAADLKKGHK